ncbi:MAG: hypothetical protein K2Z80_01525 [Xanthobacteraceae bacterium]|nr:hypothetical protein [Xanthobacteraceae bacterium]
MYMLIIVISVLSPATSPVVPVGVTSQIVGRFDSLEQCKAAANEPGATGAIVDLTLSRGIYWHCVYAGPK